VRVYVCVGESEMVTQGDPFLDHRTSAFQQPKSLCVTIRAFPSAHMHHRSHHTHQTPEKAQYFEALRNAHTITVERMVGSGKVPAQCVDAVTNDVPLLLAIARHNHDLVAFLLENGHDARDISRDRSTMNTPLIEAVRVNNFGAFERYLAHRPDSVDLTNADGDSALLLAARDGRDDYIRRLLDAGASMTIENTRGYTCVHYAAAWGHLSTLKLLIQRGASYNAANRAGWTPMDFAFNENVVKCLTDSAMEVIQSEKARRRQRHRQRPPSPCTSSCEE
jgi:hypothetical protein